jgi:hypothetical protein
MGDGGGRMTSAAQGRKYEQRIAELSEGDVASLGMVVRRAVMLSMSLTGTLHHLDGSDAWTHDDWDVAMAALDELVKRAK